MRSRRPFFKFLARELEGGKGRVIRGEMGEELEQSILRTTTFCTVSRSDLHSKPPENKEILEGCEAGVELEHVTLWPRATVSKFSFLN